MVIQINSLSVDTNYLKTWYFFWLNTNLSHCYDQQEPSTITACSDACRAGPSRERREEIPKNASALDRDGLRGASGSA